MTEPTTFNQDAINATPPAVLAIEPTAVQVNPPSSKPMRKRKAKVVVPRPPRNPRQPHELRIGSWQTIVLNDVSLQAFVLDPISVPPGMTEVVDLVTWSKKAVAPGEYDVIRVLPGKLTVGVQQTFNASFGG